MLCAQQKSKSTLFFTCFCVTMHCAKWKVVDRNFILKFVWMYFRSNDNKIFFYSKKHFLFLVLINKKITKITRNARGKSKTLKLLCYAFQSTLSQLKHIVPGNHDSVKNSKRNRQNMHQNKTLDLSRIFQGTVKPVPCGFEPEISRRKEHVSEIGDVLEDCCWRCFVFLV